MVIHGGVNNDNPFGDRNQFVINNLFYDVRFYQIDFGPGYNTSQHNLNAPNSFRGNSSSISGSLTEINDFLPIYSNSVNVIRNIKYEVLDNSLVLLPITGQ